MVHNTRDIPKIIDTIIKSLKIFVGKVEQWRKKDKSKANTLLEIYIFFLMIPAVIFIFSFILSKYTSFYYLWIAYTAQIFYRSFILYVIILLFLFLFFIYFCLKQIQYILSDRLGIFEAIFWWVFLSVKILTSLGSTATFHSAITDQSIINDVLLSLGMDTFISLILLTSIFFDIKIWNRFADDLLCNIKYNRMSYILTTLSVGSMFSSILTRGMSTLSLLFTFTGYILFLLAILVYFLRKTQYILARTDLRIYLIPIITIPILLSIIVFFNSMNSNLELLSAILAVLLILIFSIVFGAFLYWIFSFPKITIFFLAILFYLIKLWNDIQLSNDSLRIKLDRNFKNGIPDNYLFRYYLIELLLLYVLLSFFYIAQDESFSSILGIKNFLIGNIPYLGFLFVYAPIFVLFAAGFKLDNKNINTTLFHKIYSTTIIFVLILKVLTDELNCGYTLKVLILNFNVIFGISFGFLIMTNYTKEKIDKYCSTEGSGRGFLDKFLVKYLDIITE